jgi:pyruvate,water dikinase
MKSLERNHLLGRFAATPGALEGKSLPRDLDSHLSNVGVILSQDHNTGQVNDLVASFLGRLSHSVTNQEIKPAKNTDHLQAQFIESFSEAEQPFARDLLGLAKKSYQLRDDDNIYLGRIEEQFNRALLESSSRLGSKCESNDACSNYEELIRAIKDPDYVPSQTPVEKETTESAEIYARQLRGQPASKGIGRGKARVIEKIADLFSVQKGEILVCNAIDPTMTFVVPLVTAIVERRGGMLIHGAIIAREYGLPCVTGIPQATEFIKTGDDITVDGYFGLVINHSKGTLP